MSPLAIACLALLLPIGEEPEHLANPVARLVLDRGLVAGEATTKLPPPTFDDAMTAEEQRAALRKVAGSDRAVEELLHDSITAPFILRVRDRKVDGATIRSGDLTFALHVDLDSIRPAEALRQFRSEPVEAGNMRFVAKVLTADDLKSTPVKAAADGEWYTHATGLLLDRIAVESTDRVASSRSADSLVFAATCDPRFGVETPLPNRWSTLADRSKGRPEPYAGGIGLVKISGWKAAPKVCLVEVHFAFAEPTAWFDGAPILRSKFSLIAQDQIRRLRRELQKKS